MQDTSNYIKETFYKKFSLKEVLQDDSEYCDYIHKKIWHKVKSEPCWKQFKDANNQLEEINSKIIKLTTKVEELLINNSGERE